MLVFVHVIRGFDLFSAQKNICSCFFKSSFEENLIESAVNTKNEILIFRTLTLWSFIRLEETGKWTLEVYVYRCYCDLGDSARA